MAPGSDSEDEDLEFDGDEDQEAEIEDDPLDGGQDDASEDGDDVCFHQSTYHVSPSKIRPYHELHSWEASSPAPITRKRSLSPAQVRKMALVLPPSHKPLSFTVEAICALPHPVPTHSLAASHCMSHLLTGSDDGYIRDYDIFAAVNSKNFLTAPQRHHSGVVEGIMKSGQLRCWWENPMSPDTAKLEAMTPGEEESPLSPVYSLVMHSDALWGLAGSDTGHINLFTIRHEPGRLCHVMNGHRGPVSALSMDHEEKGFFSAGWDGEAIQWDLNTGQVARNFTAHGAQLAGIAVKPESSNYSTPYPPVVTRAPTLEASIQSTQPTSQTQTLDTTTLSSTNVSGLITTGLSQLAPSESQAAGEPQPPPLDPDARSDASFDPLFDDEPGDDMVLVSDIPQINTQGDPPPTQKSESNLAIPGSQTQFTQPPRPTPSSIPPPKNAPPLLDPGTYATFSPDLLMTASIDGQVILWDKRVHSPGKGVGRLWMSEKTPPWCLSACWSADGGQMYAGRRNGTIDVWDVRQLGRSGPSNTPRLLKILRNPLSSGVVSCIVAFPDCRHIACASIDNLRLWNVAEAVESDMSGRSRSGVQFKIIPGHHGGYISQMLVDPGARFLVSSSSNRGWHGDSTRTVFVHDIKHFQ
ncbi:WD40-repeat-containing domain protein [Infundibulicybe gibba]|nr:WD40-repeat-containing domain protein [Infundibulicybe gibba]